jgi:hypothetical protein
MQNQGGEKEMNRNPFQILGLSPDALKGRKDDEIQELVNAMYRTLQKFYHPEGTRPNEEKYRELVDVRDVLDIVKNREGFLVAKKSFLNAVPYRKKVEEMESRIAEAENLLARSSGRVVEHVMRSIFAHVKSEENPRDITSLRCVTIELADVVAHMNRGFDRSFESKKTMNILELDSEGRVTRIMNGEKVKQPETILIGCVSHEDQPLFKAVYYDLMKQSRVNLAIESGSISPKRGGEKIPVRRSCPLDEAMKFMPLLRPFLSKYSYLFSASISAERGIVINFEGQPVNKLF